MPLKIREIYHEGFERIIHATNESTKLNCIISVHNTRLGPALGGVRSWEYSSFEEHKREALRLSEAMTLKNSICGINFGGGKGVINLKNIKKTPELYQSYAEAVEFLSGSYLTAGDVNTLTEDLIECSKFTKHVFGINVETSEPTARGLFLAMKSVNNFINNNVELNNIHIAISGIGKVGGKLAILLAESGAKITAASIEMGLIKELNKKFQVNCVSPENLYKTECDIISPCALGSAITHSNYNLLNCKAIVGAANNQLENSKVAELLLKNKIVYSPDYLVNSGGVIAIASEINNTQDSLKKDLEKIGIRLKRVLEESKNSHLSTDLVARNMAWERINS